jgi:F0F1-type ATP synthase membrane subunit a
VNSFWNGKRRFIAGLMFAAGVFVALKVPPVIPVIQLPGEKYPTGFDLPLVGLRLTNTFMGSIIVWIILVLLAIYVARRRPKSGTETPPGGFYNMFEAVFEGLMGFVGGIAGGAHFRQIFNIFMTIFLIVLVSNWLELLPGVDSFGLIEPHVEEEYNAETGEFEYAMADGYEIYPSIVGYAVNGQCNWVSADDEASADQAALSSAESAAAVVEADLVVQEALHRFEADHTAGPDNFADEEVDSHDDEVATEEDSHDDEVAGSSDAATEVYDAVLAGREGHKQARADRGCYTDVGPVPWVADAGGDDHDDSADEEHEEVHFVAHPAPNSDEAKLVPWVVLPFIRVPSTDLNMTISLALIAFAMIQYIGFKALGISYLTKFFAFGTLFKSPLGGIDAAVGLLELIGDFAKILSFSFRLLGNIFAGSILLFVMSFLVPILPWPFFILEFGVGLIQALVFALLTAIFMNLATVSHSHDDHAEDAH